MNNLITECQDFPYLNRVICAIKCSLILTIGFLFFNILNLNKLIKNFIDASTNKITGKARQPLDREAFSRASPP